MQCSKTDSYSISSSAATSSVCGTVRPSALAVLRLMTRSNLVGSCTGRSAGARRSSGPCPAASRRPDLSPELANGLRRCYDYFGAACKHVGWRYVSTRRSRGVPKKRSFSQASINQSRRSGFCRCIPTRQLNRLPARRSKRTEKDVQSAAMGNRK